MSKYLKEQSAFPVVVDGYIQDGMTLRDYFAAKAMQGLITDEYWARSSVETAKKAYRFADEMIKARGDL